MFICFVIKTLVGFVLASILLTCYVALNPITLSFSIIFAFYRVTVKALIDDF